MANRSSKAKSLFQEEKMKKRIGVLLSGCGVYDGTEIHEAVLTLLALDRANTEAICMAPDMDQLHVVNHLNGREEPEKRNVLKESARIARGVIEDLKNVSSSNLDALILPGGYGAAKNLSDFAVKGPDAKVHPEVTRLLREMSKAKKPIGAICISPAPLVRALSDQKPKVTIGSDPGTASAIVTMGGIHQNCTVEMICVDEKNHIVSTPAYMLGPGIKEVAVGIEKLVDRIVAMIS
jgi:enhancing lycopene biosynthesis protein 2